MKLLMRSRNLNQCIRTSSNRIMFGSLSTSYLHLLGRTSTVNENYKKPSKKSDSIVANPSYATAAAVPPLSLLTLGTLIRSLVIHSIAATPLLLQPSLRIMSYLTHTSSPILNPDRNLVLSFLLKKTFYAQFCAGETPVEIHRTLRRLRDTGYAGVCLGYAREVAFGNNEGRPIGSSIEEDSRAKAAMTREIENWKSGTLQTVQMTEREDFVALKFTGAGSGALRHLLHNLPPPPALFAAIVEICDAAASKGVRLLFDAEQHAVQAGIDAWTLTFQRRYNSHASGGNPVVFGTYQAYLKACPAILAEHLTIARREGFTLGVKLVRGAYLASDPRHLIWNTKADTDRVYDGLTECLLSRTYGPIIQAYIAKSEISETFPEISVVLAGHNRTSVRRAQALRASQTELGKRNVETVYAQLMGMADEISCELLQAGQKAAASSKFEQRQNCNKDDVPKAYKYLVWGTTGECMKYLSRRAEENRDAVERTKEGRDALLRELQRRIRQIFNLGA